MATTDELIVKLIASVKRYAGLRGRYIKLDLSEKLTLLLTVLILGAVLVVIGLIAVIFLSLTLYAALHAWLDSACAAYAIVAGLFIAFCLLIYAMRQRWIVGPLSRFFTHLLLDQENEKSPRQD